MYGTEEEQKQSILNSGEALDVYSGLGFEVADRATIPWKLMNITPDGSTALRDAVKLSTNVLLDLGSNLRKLGEGSSWNFVNVILTDGEDSSSRTSLDDACAYMYSLTRNLKVTSLKTYLIGVDLAVNSKAAIEISSLALSGGDNAEYISINKAQINQIFNRLMVRVGLIKRTPSTAPANPADLSFEQQSEPYFPERQRLVILFTLDISSSMKGVKWRRVTESVMKFIGHLDQEDIVGAIVFNDTARLVLTQPNLLNNAQTQIIQIVNPPPIDNLNAPLLVNRHMVSSSHRKCMICVNSFIFIVVLMIIVFTIGQMMGFFRFRF